MEAENKSKKPGGQQSKEEKRAFQKMVQLSRVMQQARRESKPEEKKE